MTEIASKTKCKKCHLPLSGDYCSNCGQPQRLKRINGKFIASEIASIFNFERGIFYTIKELLIRPDQNVKHFILEDRNRLVKPISFVILCSLIYLIAQNYFKFVDGYINYSELGWENSYVTIIMQWISNNYGFANIIMAIFIALWAKLFFKKYDYNIFEILILLFFLIGIQMLLFSLLGMIESLTDFKILDSISGFVIAYVSWGIARFFDSKKYINYLKAFVSYMLGLLSFTLSAILLGTTIDLLLK